MGRNERKKMPSPTLIENGLLAGAPPEQSLISFIDYLVQGPLGGEGIDASRHFPKLGGE